LLAGSYSGQRWSYSGSRCSYLGNIAADILEIAVVILVAAAVGHFADATYAKREFSIQLIFNCR